VHTENSTMQMLSEFFGGRIISQNLWPPWSRTYCHRISIFVGSWRRMCTKITHTN
jgi:hypothetical protein